MQQEPTTPTATPRRVLVAFASPHGTTADIAAAIAGSLRDAGLVVDCCPAASIADLSQYEAVILGSSLFLSRRLVDGQGFLQRHAELLRDRPVWLFLAGPIGRRACHGEGRESALAMVARSIGARGTAAFATSLDLGAATGRPATRLDWRDTERVRAWAEWIARDLRQAHEQARPH
jgi:menaquinone-dependent protoporphyrinogen oxidase